MQNTPSHEIPVPVATHGMPTFIDLFAGCGGLSLGLALAGWQGMFCIEKDAYAFRTFRHNLIGGVTPLSNAFAWPRWLPVAPLSIDEVLNTYRTQLEELRGQVTLVAGGPPCQGFSFSGRRMHSDPRNQLFRRYVEFVSIVQPQILLVENVPGMRLPHQVSSTRANITSMPFSELFELELRKIGYRTSSDVIDARDFGVPQRRERLFIIGVKESLASENELVPGRLFMAIHEASRKFRRQKGLDESVTVKNAISDLEIGKPARVQPHRDVESRSGYCEVIYRRPKTKYQKLMHQNMGSLAMNSMRLARHTLKVRERMALILKVADRGTKVSTQVRRQMNKKKLGTKKTRIHVLDPHRPSPTIVTLPDDVLHYCEPRILTVRECARIQSFPDWFEFKGKYTTGGDLRVRECPRYTQVGNAVPPLLAEGIGTVLLRKSCHKVDRKLLKKTA